MRLYTIQHIDAFKALIETGTIFSSSKNIDDFFQPFYDWMVQAATKKGLPLESYPIWACYDKTTLLKLFCNRHFREYDHVCITFEVPEQLQLPSCYFQWEYVLSGMFIFYTKEESNTFFERVSWPDGEYEHYKYEDLPFDIPLQESWFRIFELDRFPNEPLQTITPKLTADMVKKIEVLTNNPYYDTFYDTVKSYEDK